MKKSLLIISILSNLFANEIWNQKVHSFGNLTTTLQYSKDNNTINLKSIQNKNSLYAIGLVKNLQGEIQIFDSTPYITSISNDKWIKFDKTFNTKASFLIYANIPQWVSFKVPNTIYNEKQFEEYLDEIADEYGIDTYKPFPYLLEGNIKANNYRIFTYNTNDRISCSTGTCSFKPKDEKESSNKKYISLTLQDTMLDTPITILGFHSLKRGEITHKYSYMNMNFITADKKIAGHCNKIMIGNNMILKLPKIK